MLAKFSQDHAWPLDWIDPKTKDGQFQTERINVRAQGGTLPIWALQRYQGVRRKLVRHQETFQASIPPVAK